MKKIILAIAYIACICFISLMTFRCTGSVKNKKTVWPTDTTCIEGHTYYIINGPYASSIAPKLQDDGRPCHCN